MRWISNLIPTLVYTVPAVLIAISLHEFAHGWASWKLGDPTPRATGRLSLNPLRHLDPIGTLCLLVFHFGWAKPVMVDPRYYKNRKRGMVLTALAGPGMNFLISLVCTLGMGLILRLTGGYVGAVVRYIYYLLFYTSAISTGLGLFNLIPVPPLDGSKVLGAVLPEDKYFGYMRYERYGAAHHDGAALHRRPRPAARLFERRPERFLLADHGGGLPPLKSFAGLLAPSRSEACRRPTAQRAALRP